MQQHPESPSSKPTNPTVDRGREALESVIADDRAQAALEFRLARYAERGRLTPDDLADLRQDLWVELVRAFERYDPARSSPGTFARHVCDLWLKQRARADVARAQRARRAMTGYIERAVVSIDPSHDALDVQMILDGLPADDAELLSAYRHWSVTELAASRGLNRSATHRRLKVISKRACRRFPRMAAEFSNQHAALSRPAAEKKRRHGGRTPGL